MTEATTTKTRGRPTLPDAERTTTGSLRLTPIRWAKLRALGMAWLAKAIDRAKAPDVSVVDPMAPIADLLAKKSLSPGERRVVNAHYAAVQGEVDKTAALVKKLEKAAQATKKGQK